MKESVKSLLPNPPAVVTISELATELSIPPVTPSRALHKAIERNLRKLREEGIARSVRVDKDTPRLGYQLVTGTKDNASDETPERLPHRPILHSRPKKSLAAGPRPDLQLKILALLPDPPATCTAKQIAARIETEYRLKPGEAEKVVAQQLLELQRMGSAEMVVSNGVTERLWCRRGSAWEI